ncbi:MAG: TetR/AcrR family transcriptional regulator C-terminal domain-containing protein, partial [Maritimibacter sp.]
DENKVQLASGREVDYDYLIIATGPELAFDEIEPLRGKVNALFDERCKIIADILHRGQQAGLHKPELNATDCALLIMSSIQGLSMRWLVHDQSFDLPSEGQRVLGGLIDSFRA